jgi:hypothetical protein
MDLNAQRFQHLVEYPQVFRIIDRKIRLKNQIRLESIPAPVWIKPHSFLLSLTFGVSLNQEYSILGEKWVTVFSSIQDTRRFGYPALLIGGCTMERVNKNIPSG